MTGPKRRRPTPAQREVLERIRDEEVYYLATSPRRSGIPKPTFSVVREAGWVEFGEEVRGQGRLLGLTDEGLAVLAEAAQ
ncbi:hypothetical protein ACFSKW_12115 [Nonomuraea mangrovi]|uniref:Uncharacterized protein n=1 Tax=Nonomuraea mangrovi TaxID=2316207 RepID=A0ABW4SV27_9ACTN